MNEAAHLALVFGDDRQHEPAAADGGLGIAGHPALGFGVAQHGGNLLAELGLPRNQLLPNLAQQG